MIYLTLAYLYYPRGQTRFSASDNGKLAATGELFFWGLGGFVAIEGALN
jgi:hypothetical protein